MYYRINTNLTIGANIIKGNTIKNLELSEFNINRLLLSGAISVISTPPLEFLPMWELRAEQLKSLGIITGVQLLDSDSNEIAEKLGRTVEMINSWKQDLIDDLIIPIERCCQ